LNTLPTYFFAVLGRKIQSLQAMGIDVISLDIGSPDMPPPPDVIVALAESARQANHHGYSGYRGIPEFREAVARYYAKRFGVILNPESEVLPLLGSKEGIVNLSLAFIDRGDLALVPDIGYPSYSMGARLAGGDVYWLPMKESAEFLPSFTSIPSEISAKAKLLWLNYPNNPTGATAEIDYYEQAIRYCLDHSVILASDNPYVDVTFDGYRASSVLEADRAKDCTVEFMSFSKTYNMGGWRLGAAVGNADILETLLQVKSNVDSGHFRAVYDAGIVALDTTPQSWTDQRNAIYQRRRDHILEALPLIGLEGRRTSGSMYIWGRVQQGTGAEYVEEALTKAHVALAPGDVYGPGGKQYVRISLGVPDDRLSAALDRLKSWYASRSVPS
jgi:LL-diaminopimelate aminotransferase